MMGIQITDKKRTLVSLVMVPILLMSLTACPQTSTVSTYINLAVVGTVNGLKLAQSFGATVSDVTIQQVQDAGTKLSNAYSAWVAAVGDPAKASKWIEVQAALNAFQTLLPDVLNAIHVTNPVYGVIASLAIQAVETVVNAIMAANPKITGVKKTAKPINVVAWKKNYDANMVQAGHPELQIQ